MKNRYLLVLFCLQFACTVPEETKVITSNWETDTKGETKMASSKDASFLNGLKAKKTALMLQRDQNELMGEVWVKVSGREELILVDQQQPDSILVTYIILRDRQDRIKLVSEFPTNQDGDREVTYEHYFGDDGQTIAFERKATFFDNSCSAGLIYETIQEYYTADFERIERIYTLKDESKNGLKKQNCSHLQDFPYKVVNHLEHYLNRIGYTV